jgi:Trk K+ transport system NAD-binding subunit
VRELQLPEGSLVVVIVRDERAIAVRPETRLVTGDKVLAITSSEREAELRTLLIGE